MSLLRGPEPFQKFAVVGGWWWVGGWWSKGIFEFRLGPNHPLGLEVWTKLSNFVHFHMMPPKDKENPLTLKDTAVLTSFQIDKNNVSGQIHSEKILFGENHHKGCLL